MSRTTLNFTYSYGRIAFRWFFVIIGFGCIFFSLSYMPSKGGDKTLWLLDNSLSMSAQDIMTHDHVFLSRFQVAQQITASGIMTLPGMHALATFHAELHFQLPFVQSNDTFFSILRAIEPRKYGGGTDIVSALEDIRMIYPYDSIHLVLLTDGENLQNQKHLPDLPVNFSMTIVGIGTKEGAKMLQGYDADGKPRYKQYAGTDAITNMDDSFLRQMSEKYRARLLLIGKSEDIQSVHAYFASFTPQDGKKFAQWIRILGACLVLIGAIVSPHKLIPSGY